MTREDISGTPSDDGSYDKEPVAKRAKSMQETIIVSGAGIGTVNGKYTRTVSTGEPTYVKSGHWKKAEATLKISPNESHGREKAWVISVQKVVNGEWTELYCSNTLVDASTAATPPGRGWWDVRHRGDIFANPPLIRRVGLLPFADWRHADSLHGTDVWTIRVNESVDYTVHRYVLENTTEYFKGLFGQKFAEDRTSTSHITMRSTVAKVFPCFLDYVYAYHGASVTILSPKRYVCPLFWLGQYFGVPQLLDDILCHTRATLCRRKCCRKCCRLLYLARHATTFGTQPLTDELTAAFHSRLGDLDLSFDDLVAKMPDVSFWVAVFGAKPITPPRSKNASQIAAELCNLNTLTVNAEQFQRLTDSTILPFLDKKAALRLMKKESEFGCNGWHFGMTSLQKRCIDLFLDSYGSDECEQLLQFQSKPFVLEFFKRYQQRVEQRDLKMNTLLDVYEYSASWRSKRSKDEFVSKAKRILRNG
ncbi:hypothetical protein MPSEU_001105700 [Mayamaea pseudoterrestris]|nr:hypothetical protein MPSEU_001105700 [Mayamaea pseudoterrestris]